MGLLLFLLTGLSTSSFFLGQYLTKTIKKNEHSNAQLNYALEHNNVAALQFSFKNTEFHSKQWLLLAKRLAKTQGEVSYQLGLYYHGHASKLIFWWENAIKLNYYEAAIALAQYYFEHDELNKAEKILSELPIHVQPKIRLQAELLNVRIAINQGKLANAQRIIAKDEQLFQQSELGQALYKDIKKYQVPLQLPIYKTLDITSDHVTATCDHSIQLFATTFAHLTRLEKLITDFKSQALNDAICFNSVRYIPIDKLNCSQNPTQAIRCNELDWQTLANTITSRYVGLMLPQGGANVHLGILYFDAKDNIDVFAHEISHLLGFVDEYPLVADHVKCQNSQDQIFSYNVAVLKLRYQGDKKDIREQILKQVAWGNMIKDSTPILQKITDPHGKQYWQVGTPEAFKDEVGVFKAKTCDKRDDKLTRNFNAFKPVSYGTKLQYDALIFPAFYLELLNHSSTLVMPSFHYNIALAYFQEKNIEQAKYWLSQAAKWEADPQKRNIILQGDFN